MITPSEGCGSSPLAVTRYAEGLRFCATFGCPLQLWPQRTQLSSSARLRGRVRPPGHMGPPCVMGHPALSLSLSLAPGASLLSLIICSLALSLALPLTLIDSLTHNKKSRTKLSLIHSACRPTERSSLNPKPKSDAFVRILRMSDKSSSKGSSIAWP